MATASPTTPAAPLPVGHLPPRLTDPSDVVRVGGKKAYLADLYHFFLIATWRRVIAMFMAVYTGINALFACLYLAGGNCIQGATPGSFGDAFFFSVQTFSTIGYGCMSPKTTYANVLTTIEAFVSLLAVAMATGLTFAKFSRPTARVLFSNKLVIGTRNGKPMLTLRMANERGNDIIEASLRVTILKPEISAEGERIRRLHDITLIRSDTPLFTISFTAFHIIDETSPLYGETAESLQREAMRFIVTVTGLDATFAQTIHARHIYEARDVAWNARFVDVLSSRPDGRLQMDLSKFHDVVAC
ncbi:Kef-type K+ transport system protein [Minicystis rosea]|nr:Kef-type K+ transport system protein [Minicystis rosea]